ncbi:hypothetical protein PMAYCL1PPCAC_33007, partial [Pristionchus mayeri]
CIKCSLHQESSSHCSQGCKRSACPCYRCQLFDNRRAVSHLLWDLHETDNLSTEAKAIRYLLTSLASDSFNDDAFNYNEISHLFFHPTMTLPQKWAPLNQHIVELVRIALSLLPRFQGIDFGARSVVGA